MLGWSVALKRTTEEQEILAYWEANFWFLSNLEALEGLEVVSLSGGYPNKYLVPTRVIIPKVTEWSVEDNAFLAVIRPSSFRIDADMVDRTDEEKILVEIWDQS